ncbi:hypothetical protein Taro_051201 [Colocasia esculenta]|uniref:Uncharacterized protein n=1 Tax=Colocasia esculenta TaxID=4460 RepID=A0A843XFD1_COLES|nr:hypothetical protein [Colocasia esculenta]
MSPSCWGCVLLTVCLALRACASLGIVLCLVGIFARAKQMLVCRVATLVERCDTCLWLLPALCWLFVNSGEVFPEFFSVCSGGGEVFPKTVLCSFLVVVAALPSGLRDELSLLPVGLFAFSLPRRCRLRCVAFDHGSCRCAGQVVFLLIFRCFLTALVGLRVPPWSGCLFHFSRPACSARW